MHKRNVTVKKLAGISPEAILKIFYAAKHSYPGFETQVRCLLKSEIGVSVAPRTEPMEFSLNCADFSLNSVNSENLTNHWRMNWGQFKVPRCYLHLPCTVISTLSLTQHVRGLSTEILLIFGKQVSLNSANSFRLGKTEMYAKKIKHCFCRKRMRDKTFHTFITFTSASPFFIHIYFNFTCQLTIVLSEVWFPRTHVYSCFIITATVKECKKSLFDTGLQ